MDIFVLIGAALMGLFLSANKDFKTSKFDTWYGKQVISITGLLRAGIGGQLAYWAIPVVVFWMFSIAGGGMIAIALGIGVSANRKYVAAQSSPTTDQT